MSGEIWIAIITSITAIVTAVISHLGLQRERTRRIQAEQEMRFTRASLDLGSFIQEWEETHNEIMDLLEMSEIDRFMLLRAWNGMLEPRWTTAVLQIRAGDQKPISYVHFELDEDYQARLRQLAKETHALYIVDQMSDAAAIKSVYKSEGVKAAVWSMIERRPYAENTASIIYCSFATHDASGITEETFTRCRILTGRLKGAALLFRGES